MSGQVDEMKADGAKRRREASMGQGNDGGSDQHPLPDGHLWPMGAVTRRTGIGEHTLRAWERRFGFPAPHRLESGHRRYPADQVQHLLLINEALNHGYRAGDVVPLPRTELEELLRSCGAFASEVETSLTPAVIENIFDASRRFDRDAIATALNTDASLLGTRRFLRERVAPLLDEVGKAWAEGSLEVRHEHFFSEVLEDTLRSLRVNLEPSGRGRPVVLATLPDEFHGLGLHIAALAVAASGRRVRVLGPHLPVDEIAKAADSVDASAVGLSISIFGTGVDTSQAVRQLREQLPSSVELWIGGAGGPHLDNLPSDVRVLGSLDDLDSALQRL